MAFLIGSQIGAIVWAQSRFIVNYYIRRRSAAFWRVLTAISMLVWYGGWSAGSYIIASIAANPANLPLVSRALPVGLFFVFLYWQLVPMIMAGAGLSLDLKRLLVYPVPHWQFFAVETALRITLALEMILVTAGLAIGLVLNPSLPWWTALALVPFTLANLFLSAGIRDFIARVMERKWLREGAVLLVVLAAALPQLLLTSGGAERLSAFTGSAQGPWWPWSATAEIALGHISWVAVCALLGSTGLAYAFGRWQFERSLRFDAAEARAARSTGKSQRLSDLLFRLPDKIMPDPLAVLLGKELRVLSRAPRFRLLFAMGFTFGLLIWLPMVFRSGEDSAIRSNFLTIVSAYALMLLGEVCFWNSFGLDRAAAQTYFVTPVRLETVLLAKNLAAGIAIALELLLVAIVCTIVRLPLRWSDLTEALAVTAVLSLFFVSFGNMLSVRSPRGVNPSQSWRTGSVGRVQAFLLVLYPLAAGPVALAYAARFAFESELAFYGVLTLDLMIGMIVYSVATESAVAAAQSGREAMIHSLSNSDGPLAS